MSLPKTIRLEDSLEKEVKAYIDKNNIKFKQLLSMALREFMSKTHSVEVQLHPVTDEDYERLTKENMKKHKNTLDLLK